jgi:hypothetical protein
MLARLTVAVPYIMLVPEGVEFELPSYEDGDCRVIPRPPVHTDAPIAVPIPDIIDFEGVRGYVANALQVDFQKDSFDRRTGESTFDPKVEVMARAVHAISTRLRAVTRSLHIPTPDFPKSSWRVVYLNDDGSEVPRGPTECAARGGIAKSIRYSAVSQEIWHEMWSLPADWKPPVWDDLLLDANAALPKIGTALVLGATALEVFIAEILDKLAERSDVRPDLWAWINNRKVHEQEPSTEDQFDVLLKMLSGHSLKENSELWTAFCHLRTARNRFVHEGRATLSKNRVPVTEEEALRLLVKANEIVTQVRSWIPEALHWPKFDIKSKVTASFKMM